jgi:hypothetical protein
MKGIEKGPSAVVHIICTFATGSTGLFFAYVSSVICTDAIHFFDKSVVVNPLMKMK